MEKQPTGSKTIVSASKARALNIYRRTIFLEKKALLVFAVQRITWMAMAKKKSLMMILSEKKRITLQKVNNNLNGSFDFYQNDDADDEQLN